MDNLNKIKLFVFLKIGGDNFNYGFLKSYIVNHQSGLEIKTETEEKVLNVFEKCKINEKVSKFYTLFDKDLNCNFFDLFDREDIEEVIQQKCFITKKPIDNDFIIMDGELYSIEAINGMSSTPPKLKQKLLLPIKGTTPLKPLTPVSKPVSTETKKK